MADANRYLDLAGLTEYHGEIKTKWFDKLDGTVERTGAGTGQSPYVYTLKSGVKANAPSADADVSTKKYVDDAVKDIVHAMVFKGTVGTGGTIEWGALPVATTSNEGWTYKVITAHATAPICNVGDTIVSNGSAWIVIPSGDEPAGTVLSVAPGTGLTTSFESGQTGNPGDPIIDAGTINLVAATNSVIGGVSVATTSTISNSSGAIDVKTDNATIQKLTGNDAGKLYVRTATNSDSSTTPDPTIGELGVVRGSIDTGVIVTDGTLSIQRITDNEITALFPVSGD